MKLIKKYNQHRRDCFADLKCENCGNECTNKGAYDDRNYWDKVVPAQTCEECGKSTNDMGLKPENVSTKYAPYETV